MKAMHDRAVPRLHARPHHVRHPVLHGPPRRRRSRCSASRSPTRAYVVASHAIMTRMGTPVLDVDRATDADFVPGLHSVGAPLEPGPGRRRRGRATTPSTSPTSPRRARSGRYGSGYGGNALLGKKCYSLRIASVMARDEGWLAEHMLILKLTSPERQRALHRGGLPVAPAARPTSRCSSPPSRAGRSRPSATTSPGCASVRTAGCTRSTPSTACSASRPAPAGTPTPTRCAPSPRATRSSPTSRSPTTATSGGRA